MQFKSQEPRLRQLEAPSTLIQRIEFSIRDFGVGVYERVRGYFSLQSEFDAFDFKGVSEVGQGFVDEIYRVFASSHPDIQLLFENTNSTVSFMISRALKHK